ncbi:UNVERIFIED_ORG: hypothetical protein J2Y77_002231 [Pseudomonas lini]
MLLFEFRRRDDLARAQQGGTVVGGLLAGIYFSDGVDLKS